MKLITKFNGLPKDILDLFLELGLKTALKNDCPSLYKMTDKKKCQDGESKNECTRCWNNALKEYKSV